MLGPSGFRGGLVLSPADSRLRQRRHGKPQDSTEPDADYTLRLSGEYNYGGMVHHHFSHFMSEMVHRIVPSKLQHGDRNWIFVTTKGNERLSFDTLPKFVREVFQL